MILKKIIAGLFLLFFLNGCVQSTALLGPAYTMASTGNIYIKLGYLMDPVQLSLKFQVKLQ